MKKLNQELLNDIRTEVNSSYSKEEMIAFKTFEDFWNQVDIQNGYEEEWKPKKYKPYYEAIYKELK